MASDFVGDLVQRLARVGSERVVAGVEEKPAADGCLGAGANGGDSSIWIGEQTKDG